ncbi:MAG: 6-carboxytetrahydropterin synthase QueD [Dehalococcoidia bacterium]|nr:6-carboxytetrahydropterin synthase QueD [Dehalococcoidia bacterium]
MFQVKVKQHFDAAHYLREYKGKCENLHGHRFEVVAALEVEQLNGIGLAYDFVELKSHLRKIMAKFDHVSLNDTPPFDKITPSSENIATAIYKELQSRIPPAAARIAFIEVWESPENCVTYRPETS